MPKQNCGNCRWGTGSNVKMWCCKHAPIAVPNPDYRKGQERQVVLSMQPDTYAEASCGDWEEKKNA